MTCPICGESLIENLARNALSRVMEGEYICVQCGNREAMLDHRASNAPKDRRVCLYSDEPTGIMLVVENEPGFEPFGRRPRDPLWAKMYCQAWNAAVDLTDRDVDDILASSMFGRWAHF
jgi:hypothetical protein